MVEVTKQAPATKPAAVHRAKPPAIPGKKTKEQLRGLPPSKKTLAQEKAADAEAKTADDAAAKADSAKKIADAAAQPGKK
jgi:hypothetical protein